MIFTFTGTGNSYAVAKSIAEATGNNLIDIATAVRHRRYTFDAKGLDIGFVFPTYYLGLPYMVLEFAKNVVVLNPGRVFCVTTCGGASGGACQMLSETLAGRLNVDACYDIVMPDNAVFAFDAPSKEQVERILNDAEGELQNIIESIRNGESGDLCRNKGNYEDWRGLYAKYDEARVTEPFRLTDSCVECKICAELCPEKIIKFYHRRPVWDEDKCSQCMSCVNMCPKQAIEYGDSTVGRGRYYHPDFYSRTLGVPLKFE